MTASRALPGLLEETSRRFPERLALVDAEIRLTYSDLQQRVERMAGWLVRNGLMPGERVCIVLESSWQYVVALYGALRAGAIGVPLNSAARAGELAGWVSHSEAGWVIGDPGARESAALRRELPGSVRWAEVSEAISGGSSGQSNEARTVGSGTAACIHYTSGTTGAPKGVLLSHGNLASNAEAIAGYLDLDQYSSIVSVLPFYYAYGSSVLHSHILRGGKLVIERGFTFPHVTMQKIASEKATGFAGVPSTFALLLARVNLAEHDIGSLRYLTQAGGAMSPALTLRVRAAFPSQRLFVMYGQTEATSRVSFLPPQMLEQKLGSVGTPIEGVEWQIRSEEGEVLPAGRSGALWIRGPNVMMGYWQNPQASAAVLRDSWLCTGDVGRLDDDGFLYLEGRRNDIIKVGAHRIHPQDIEHVVGELDGVEEAAAVGMDDELLGEVVKVCVVLRPGAALTEQQIRRHCLERLPGYKVPKLVEFVTALPRTASGKLRRIALSNRMES